MRSAKLVLAILLLFLCILLNLSAFLISFLPISGSIPKHNFLFSSYILFYFGILSNLYLIFRSCIPRTLSCIVTTSEYFRILPHRSLSCLSVIVHQSITSYFLLILFYFGVLPNLYPSFCLSLPRFLSRMVDILGYLRLL